ncbi:MAG: S49 family peptidase [Ignavibacteria bacterium]|nr:S49 family peptidase [Ignavibacteria bacterium]
MKPIFFLIITDVFYIPIVEDNMRLRLLAIIVFFITACGLGQSRYTLHSDMGQAPAGTMKYGLYGYDNPAILQFLESPDLLINWTTYNKKQGDDKKIGIHFAAPGFGVSIRNERQNGITATEYSVMLSEGTQSAAFGVGYSWMKGDLYPDYSSLWTFGMLLRPNPYTSFGLTEYVPSSNGNIESVAELSIRPFKNETIALFGQYLGLKEYSPLDSKWSAGASMEALPGVCITGRYFENKTVTAGVRLELGNIGVSTQSYFNTDQKYSYNSYGIRLGAYDRNILESMRTGNESNMYYVRMSRGVEYLKFRYFDNHLTLMELLQDLDAAKADPSVSGVFVNMTSISGSREMLWEVREKLRELKESGKKIHIFLDRAGINEYHFASVANKVYMDPLGTIALEGFLNRRTYYKGALQKLGIGYDEFRFFKYKSAAESFSRDKMSEADREQRQKLVDDWYKLAKNEITESRNITGVVFDSLVNDIMMFTASDAKKYNLIDEIVRWDELKERFGKDHVGLIESNLLLSNMLPHDNYWGEKPKVAVIYALGECAMESGINAYNLRRDVQAAVDDNNVKAIVLRVDSPGGDALASDYIAAVLLRAKGKKPIIVSQGMVAASGGYWLSMYADTIVAAPSTITGSIGVIGGFFYDNGFKNMIGFSTDKVQQGEHADIGTGIVLPLLNLGIPDRQLTQYERSKVEVMITGMYSEFVDKVALGRHKTHDQIHDIAQGRVWSGYDGLKNGLVDKLGGLETAINIAVEKARLKKGDYQLVEMPTPGLFDFSQLMPKLFNFSVVTEDKAIQEIKFRMQYNNRPLFMLPMDWEVK